MCIRDRSTWDSKGNLKSDDGNVLSNAYQREVGVDKGKESEFNMWLKRNSSLITDTSITQAFVNERSRIGVKITSLYYFKEPDSNQFGEKTLDFGFMYCDINELVKRSGDDLFLSRDRLSPRYAFSEKLDPLVAQNQFVDYQNRRGVFVIAYINDDLLYETQGGELFRMNPKMVELEEKVGYLYALLTFEQKPTADISN
eukprot:TRINITY_DN2255_c0_g1_i1.p1 TRINITY_DN2255_c0_g1~~TRINITY_DN2255_c0_g1_i1.p1  ORF type:complete len:219 (+),score=48.81 TRINITY_DN2255_c0_g1_i1:61-657(+)